MNSQLKPLEELVKELPPAFQAEVRDFIEFLLEKRRRKSNKTLRQNWAGARKFDLKEMVSRMPRNYKAREESFGKPAGKEEW